MTTADIKDVSMTYSSALEIAKAIDDKRLDFNGMRGTLENLVDSLSGQWEGTTQREFLTAYNKLKPKLKLICETMERYSMEIRAVVNAEKETEKGSSSGFKGINEWFGSAAISGTHGKSSQGPSTRGTRKEGMLGEKTKSPQTSNHAEKKADAPISRTLEERKKQDYRDAVVSGSGSKGKTYQEKVDYINQHSGIGEVQHYQNYAGQTLTYQPDASYGGQCNWVALTTIIQRAIVGEGGKSNTTCMDLLNSNPSSMEYYMKEGRFFQTPDGRFSVENVSGPFTDTRLCELLEAHPEGIMIYDQGHWIVLTDYEKTSAGIQYYANDGVNNGSAGIPGTGRIKLEDTWFYKYNGGRLSSLDQVRVVERVDG